MKETTICIAGGGSSGLLLGLLLAKQGRDVTVLESRGNFERSFRGEVLQPRFVKLMKQLNLDWYLEGVEHVKLVSGEVKSGESRLMTIDYPKETPGTPYAVRMNQAAFLQALYELAATYPSFHFFFDAEVKQVIKNGGNVAGVIASIGKKETIIHARLVVGADGRYSKVRREGGFPFRYRREDFDVIWFTAPRKAENISAILFKVNDFSNFIVTPKSAELLQVGFTLKKGQWNKIRKKGLDYVKMELIKALPDLEDFLSGMKDFHSFVPLKSETFFVREWYQKGCVLIGDAVHCSSPLGAIGISLALETAVLLADLIVTSFHEQDLEFRKLENFTRMRADDILMVHRMQKMLSFVMITGPKWLRKTAIGILPLINGNRLQAAAKRRFLLGTRPLRFHSSLIFSKEDFSKIKSRSNIPFQELLPRLFFCLKEGGGQVLIQ